MHYLLPYELGGAVNTAEKEEDAVIQSTSYGLLKSIIKRLEHKILNSSGENGSARNEINQGLAKQNFKWRN